MRPEPGHNYTFGSPSKAGGWPTFGPDGKIVREMVGDPDDPASQSEVCRAPAVLGDGSGSCIKSPVCGRKCLWAGGR